MLPLPARPAYRTKGPFMSQRITCLSVMSMISLVAITLAVLSMPNHMGQQLTTPSKQVQSCSTIVAEGDQGYGNFTQPVEIACNARGNGSITAVASR
jgi:hypothetical protein